LNIVKKLKGQSGGLNIAANVEGLYAVLINNLKFEQMLSKEQLVDFMTFLRDEIRMPILYSNMDDYADEYIESKNGIKPDVIGSTSMTAEKATSEIPQVANSNQWISVKDDLPELGDEVVAYCPESRHNVTALCRFNRYEGATDFYWDNHYGGSNVHIQESVTYWMPLPHPPMPKA